MAFPILALATEDFLTRDLKLIDKGQPDRKVKEPNYGREKMFFTENCDIFLF